MTILVLLAALGMTLLWWWQGYQKDSENRERLVNSVVNEATSTTEKVEPTQSEAIQVTETKPTTDEPVQNEVVNVLQQPQQTETVDTQPEQPVVAGSDELRIEITGSQSWITVRGAKNKRLAEKLYNNGEVLTFNDNEQYRLTIGAPANVKLYYKGQEVPLKIDGRVARIRLPLQ